MFYSELKEIVARKFCFNYIGLEFLMKNNKSNLLNFFNKDNYISFIKKMFVKIWENKPRNEKNDIFIFQLTKNITSLPIITMNLDEDTKFIFVQNLCNYFEIEQFSNKHLNGEISNFKYLLLINKYSSRSYNNEFQYLIFPLLYMDTKRKKERDLSKAIALNKESPDLEETIFKLKQNYSNFGCYFNTHYSKFEKSRDDLFHSSIAYNKAVSAYNNFISSFPGSMIATLRKKNEKPRFNYVFVELKKDSQGLDDLGI